MIRLLLLLAALAVVGQSSVALYGDTRALVSSSRSIPELLGRKASGGVVLVLQVDDCRRSGKLVSTWNTLNSAGRFPVTGMVVGSGRLSERERAIFRRDGVRFPLRGLAAADAEAIAQKLGFRSTPFAIVLDHRGRVATAFPASMNVPVDALARLTAPPAS
jgi:hypothetical protein